MLRFLGFAGACPAGRACITGRTRRDLKLTWLFRKELALKPFTKLRAIFRGEKTVAREKRALEACGLELKPGKMFILTGNAEELESVGGKVRAIPLMEWLLG